MKIRDISCYPLWGGFRNYTIVVVDTDEGLYGLGEAGLTGRELAMVGAIEHLKPLLIGQDAARIEHLWQLVSRCAFFPHGKVLGSVLSAIDIALWDLRGKALGVPVYELLGGRVRDKCVCYPHISGRAVPGDMSLVEAAQRKVAEGWKFVRWHLPEEDDLLEPAQAIRRGVREFQAVREAVGDEIDICIDLHTRLSSAEAIQYCREVQPLRPYFIEDPIRSESPQAYHLLRQKIDVPLAAGEQYCSKWEFRELIDHDLIDYARIDLCIAGGFTEGKKIAGWCEGHYIDVAVHNPLGPVATSACVHFNLAIPNFAVQEQARLPGDLFPEVIQSDLTFADGCINASNRPGLDLTFDREAAAKYAFQMRELPHLHRADGSFTNW
ncbi:MAG: mandelate racemase/muconate lactonizing enzyme family protein [Chloroflexi bacterium]|nr:mandelate racemase/muconate lactonizing enzyme family protein [Chloroflexota bacterium]